MYDPEQQIEQSCAVLRQRYAERTPRLAEDDRPRRSLFDRLRRPTLALSLNELIQLYRCVTTEHRV